jgi:transmembrane sensor
MGRNKAVDEALRRFLELDTADRIEGKWGSFERWVRKRPEHDEVFSALERDSLAARLLGDFDSLPEDMGSVTPKSASWVARVWLAIVHAPKLGLAAVAVLIGASVIFGPPLHREHFVATEDWQSFETTVGQHRQITFADGSTADLNTDTALRAHVTTGHRETRLERGEALFDIVHDELHPFVVRAGKSHVDAIGTKFTVSMPVDRPLTAMVAEGKVEVYIPSQDPQMVGPRQLATATPQGIEVVTLQSPDIERRTAWTKGELSFDHESLEEVVEEFNRYNDKHLRILDPAILKYSVAGVYSATDPQKFATLIRYSLGVRFKAGISREGQPTIDLFGTKE